VSLPIAQAAELSGARTVIDVGSGHGELLTALLATHPSIEKGILFDQPHVIDEARAALGPAPDERIWLESGDFFTALPAGADVYVMKWILHDWDDAICVKLLTTCRDAMAPTAGYWPPSSSSTPTAATSSPISTTWRCWLTAAAKNAPQQSSRHCMTPPDYI
jgi:hypothetical protein